LGAGGWTVVNCPAAGRLNFKRLLRVIGVLVASILITTVLIVLVEMSGMSIVARAE
jgi:hypothetical protein